MDAMPEEALVGRVERYRRDEACEHLALAAKPRATLESREARKERDGVADARAWLALGR
jgi:hypothetical protein